MVAVVIGDNTGDDYPGTEDTELTETNPTANTYTDTNWLVSSFATSDRRHVVLSYSRIGSLPSGLTVNTATNYLYHDTTANSGSTNVIRFRKLLRNWVEAEATWNIWSTGNNWTTAGALSDGNDRSSTTTVDFSPGTTTGSYKSASSAQLAADVQSMRASANYGWLLSRPTESTYDTYYDSFLSSKSFDGFYPYLAVDYTAAGGTTLQSSLMLMGVGI